MPPCLPRLFRARRSRLAATAWAAAGHLAGGEAKPLAIRPANKCDLSTAVFTELAPSLSTTKWRCVNLLLTILPGRADGQE